MSSNLNEKPSHPPYREVRAAFTETTVRVYQAFSPAIAGGAVAAQRFSPPFSRERMTWIKPSFTWMMYRSSWAEKPGQYRTEVTMGKILPARIRFLSSAEGGFRNPPKSGVRPQLALGDVLTSCVVTSKTESEFQFGKEYNVELDVVFWDEYGDRFRENMDVELHDGSRIVARGRFT